jgi:hypothetical protein
MEERPNLAEVEHEIDLRAAAVASFIKGLRAQHGRHLEELDALEWIVTHHSPATADLLASYRRILVRFLDDYANTLHGRLGADIESGVIAALNAGHRGLAARPTNAKMLAKEMASKTGHPVVGSTPSMATDSAVEATTDSQHLLSALAADHMFGASPALHRSEALFDELIAQWTRHERDEARALVDDAHARAAVARYLPQVTANDDTLTPDAVTPTAADPLGDDPVLDLSGHSLAGLLELFGGTVPSSTSSRDEWWHDAPEDDTENDDAPDETGPAPAAVAEHVEPTGSDAADAVDAVDAAETAGAVITLSEEQLDIAFADFWTGDLARQATARFTEAIGQQQAAQRTSRPSRRSEPRRRSNLVAGIVPVVGLTAAITLLMALVG